ncbi:hypothetical protein ACQ4PT_071667 [Festuca glaucescens]
MSSRGGGAGGRRGGHGRGGESPGGQEGGRGRGGGGGRGRGPGGEVEAERGGHGHATRGRAGELGGRGGDGRGRGSGGDAARGARGGGGGRVQPSASQPAAVGQGGVGTVREHDPQYGGAGIPRPGGQVAAPTAAADVLAAEVERKMALQKADERTSSSSATAAAAEHSNLQESRAVVAAPGSLPPVSSKAEKFPGRPGFGTVGKRCRVRANHFLVQVADKNIYHYDVEIYPETRSRDQNRSIINELVRLHRQYLDGRLPVYDGRKSIYTAGALPFKNKEFVIKLVNANRGNQREEEYRVAIKHASNLDLYNLQQFLADISATSFYKAQPVMAFAVEYLNPRDASRLSDQDCLKIVNRNNYGNDSFSKEFGMKVTNQLALVDARVLPAPSSNITTLDEIKYAIL